ncbi:hypothetical protein LEP1GSC041_3111 [Leptospira noguchii str. 2006001870]|uniref:Uncharacterized protein n=1 Tax=Leptospira noguchii serovar Autumnalis str. ZUN142 TaxID=1085540 RepID=M6ULY6_9LEPT|nr:hypothetical protein LEP1GSC041_3111 [Leptospira noguchii str. 2006001870]EMO42049.1 hypothetical protein LEP1GSC186_0528 [Leptospira noguchii serovar Autumnalis str. ZUN142]
MTAVKQQFCAEDDDSFCNSSHISKFNGKFTICNSSHIYFLRKN